MSIERGVITKINGGKALVESVPSINCDTCAEKGSCAHGQNTRKRNIWLENNINAKIGDQVIFKIEEKGVILYSFVLYFLPIVLMIIGIFLGLYYNALLNIDKDLASAIGGFIGLIISVIIIKIFSYIVNKNKIFPSVLIDVDNKNLNC